MKALIVLENHFFLDANGIVWCDRVVDYNYLKRYLSVFENIVLTGRTEFVDKIKDSKLLVSGENVEFVPMPNFKGAKGLILNIFKLKKIIRNQIKKCDCAIYRAPTHLSLFTYKEVIKENKILALEFMMAANKMFDGDVVIKKILNKLVDKKAKKMCLKAKAVSYVTDYVLQKEYPCMAIIKPNSKEYFTESYSSIDLEQSLYYKQTWNLNEKPNCIKLIHVGYMDSNRKGQDVAIKALKKVLDMGYNAELVLIGDGEKKKEFEKLTKSLNVSENVKFKGLIKDKKTILNELRNSHIFIFPTQSEGLPRTIIEAMSQGIVCISSPVDGIPELLDEEFLINFNDVDGYAYKIIDLINNWAELIKESEKNYNKSLKFEKQLLEKKRINFYSNIKRSIKK